MPVFESNTKTISVNTQPDNVWYRQPFRLDGTTNSPSLSNLWNRYQYGEIYRRQPVVRRVVDKYQKEITKLPLKVYERVPDGFGGTGRHDGRGSLYGALLANPHPFMNRVAWLSWIITAYFINGEAFLWKQRDGATVNDRGGLPKYLLPIHPTKVRYGPAGGGWSFYHNDDFDVLAARTDAGESFWWVEGDDGTETMVPRHDMVQWKRPNPDSLHRGLSHLETLRGTLEDEAAMRTARTSHWRHGGHPAFVLEYDGEWLEGSHAGERLRNQFMESHGGPFKAGMPLILEDGIKAKEMPMQADLDYLGSRKLNEREVIAQYDMPEPAVGVHDASTYSNIQELMESMARDTIAPELTSLEAALEFDLRDGRFGAEGEPDFSDVYYAEFEMSGIARGSFRDRIDANARQIATGQATVNEVRRRENLPPVEGGDDLLINAALVPVDQLVDPDIPTDPRLNPGQRITNDPGRDPAMDDGGEDGSDIRDERDALIGPGPLSIVMGRLSRQKTLADIDITAVVDGIEPQVAEAVKACHLLLSNHMDGTVAQLRQAIKRMRF